MRSLLGIVAAVFLGTASAATIDFEDLVLSTPPSPEPVAGPITSGGFVFSGTGNPQPLLPLADLLGNTSQSLAFCPDCTLSFATVDGRPFDLRALAFSVVGTGALVEVTGIGSSGSIVQTTLTDTAKPNFTTSAFGSGWQRLSRAEVRAVDGQRFATAIDDIVVNVVPVPAAAWLFMSGLGLLGWLRRA